MINKCFNEDCQLGMKKIPNKSIDMILCDLPYGTTKNIVELCRYLIKTYTNENDIVLDNCMGSGTTAEACFFESRNFIGFDNGTCEKTKVPFAEIAQKRYEDLKEKYLLLKDFS